MFLSIPSRCTLRHSGATTHKASCLAREFHYNPSFHQSIRSRGEFHVQYNCVYSRLALVCHIVIQGLKALRHLLSAFISQLNFFFFYQLFAQTRFNNWPAASLVNISRAFLAFASLRIVGSCSESHSIRILLNTHVFLTNLDTTITASVIICSNQFQNCFNVLSSPTHFMGTVNMNGMSAYDPAGACTSIIMVITNNGEHNTEIPSLRRQQNRTKHNLLIIQQQYCRFERYLFQLVTQVDGTMETLLELTERFADLRLRWMNKSFFQFKNLVLQCTWNNIPSHTINEPCCQQLCSIDE